MSDAEPSHPFPLPSDDDRDEELQLLRLQNSKYQAELNSLKKSLLQYMNNARTLSEDVKELRKLQTPPHAFLGTSPPFDIGSMGSTPLAATPLAGSMLSPREVRQSPPAPSWTPSLTLGNPDLYFRACLADSVLNTKIHSALSAVLPSPQSESRRADVMFFVRALIKRALGAQVYPHGSFALKTYVPEDVMGVSAFFSRGHEGTWIQRIVTALCQEAFASRDELGPEVASPAKPSSASPAPPQLVAGNSVSQVAPISVSTSYPRNSPLHSLGSSLSPAPSAPASYGLDPSSPHPPLSPLSLWGPGRPQAYGTAGPDSSSGPTSPYSDAMSDCMSPRSAYAPVTSSGRFHSSRDDLEFVRMGTGHSTASTAFTDPPGYSRNNSNLTSISGHCGPAGLPPLPTSALKEDPNDDAASLAAARKQLVVENVSIAFVGPYSRVVLCRVGGLDVCISGNHVTALASLVLFEEADRLLDKNHLFKRSVLLFKLWAIQSGVFDPRLPQPLNTVAPAPPGAAPALSDGLLSNDAIHTLMLVIFNAFHQEISTPLQALFKLLLSLEAMDWGRYALDVFGPVEKTVLGSAQAQRGPSELRWHKLSARDPKAPGTRPLISGDLLRKYRLSAPGGSTLPSRSDGSLVLVEPLHSINLFAHLSPASHAKLAQAFTDGAAQLKSAMLQYSATKTMDSDSLLALLFPEQFRARLADGGWDSVAEASNPFDSYGVFAPVKAPRSTPQHSSQSDADLIKPSDSSALLPPLMSAVSGSSSLSSVQLQLPTPPAPSSRKAINGSEGDASHDGGDTPPADPGSSSRSLTPGEGNPSPTSGPTTAPSSTSPELAHHAEGEDQWLQHSDVIHASAAAPAEYKARHSLPADTAGASAEEGEGDRSPPPAVLAIEKLLSTNDDDDDPVVVVSAPPAGRVRSLDRPPSNSRAPSKIMAASFGPLLVPPSDSNPGGPFGMAPSPSALSSASEGDGSRPAADPLSTDLELISAHFHHARQFQTPDISEDDLIALVSGILAQHGSVPVGRMGSLLHDATNNHSLPAMLKERYGGLKRFLEGHKDVFVMGTDHPYNPHVSLRNPPPPGSAPPIVSSLAPLVPSAAANGPADPNAAADPSGRRRTQRAGTRRNRGRHRSGSLPGAPLTTCIAMDCEMVGVGPGGVRSALARCVIVNYTGDVVYDKYVVPTEKVTDYRTAVSGITPAHLRAPPSAVAAASASQAMVGGISEFKTVREEVAAILKNRVLVGHSLSSDLQALQLTHPPRLLRDSAFYPALCPHRPLPLKRLAKERLNMEIQVAEHNPIEDCRAALAIYKSCRKEWEQHMAEATALDSMQNVDSYMSQNFAAPQLAPQPSYAAGDSMIVSPSAYGPPRLSAPLSMPASAPAPSTMAPAPAPRPPMARASTISRYNQSLGARPSLPAQLPTAPPAYMGAMRSGRDWVRPSMALPITNPNDLPKGPGGM